MLRLNGQDPLTSGRSHLCQADGLGALVGMVVFHDDMSLNEKRGKCKWHVTALIDDISSPARSVTFHEKVPDNSGRA
jgi:hypothetical protein